MKELRPASESSPSSRENSPAGGKSGEVPASSERPYNQNSAPGASFADVLARHMGETGGQDIVRAAHLVLRDGDSGLIRLRLEPDSLGNVKIELKMTENNITGRIIVETEEAKTAFERSLAGLRDAFTAGGFGTASLEVSVGGGGAHGGNAAEDRIDPYFSERLRDLDQAVPGALTFPEASGGGLSIWA
ncbi:MAG TPA: flagellar hook-length control protein FliK [Magnetospirillaceae bacterium]|nr:flagellar hook-length control protein FliK [Magnetospirillaceae bacterium]